jgi:hypothetical protein
VVKVDTPRGARQDGVRSLSIDQEVSMGDGDTLARIAAVFRDVLDDDDLGLTRATTAADVMGGTA